MASNGRRAYGRERFSDIVLLNSQCNQERSDSENFYFTSAKSLNLSVDGMAFNLRYPLREGSCLNIDLCVPGQRGQSRTYRSEVRWCKKVSGSEAPRFLAGVKFLG